jgi:O-antigen ligase
VHNDPIQLLAEGGLVGSALLAMILLPLWSRIVRCLAGAKGTLAVGFAAGLTGVMLHSLVDFSFHMPANATVAAALAGVLLGLPWRRPS